VGINMNRGLVRSQQRILTARKHVVWRTIMLTTTRYAFLVLILIAGSIAHADGDSDPTARAKAIAPYIGEQTIAVVHMDLSALEVGDLVDKFVQLVPDADIDGEMRANLKKAHSAFTSAGFSDFYVVVSLADIPASPPFIIVPKGDETKVAELQKLLPSSLRDSQKPCIEEFPKAVFIGSRRALARLRTFKPDSRPELAKAFEAAGDTDMQFLLLPTDNDRRVVQELMPTLPEVIGGGPSTIVTRGVRWLALGIDAPPKISLRLAIQSADSAAAAALRAKWLEVAQFLSQQEIPHRALREIDKAIALLTPEVEGDRLVLSLGEPDRSIEALLAAVTPPLEHARTEAKRSQSMNNLKQLGLAMHNFYDRHKRFPAIGTFDATGKPLLSWRVHILPYVDQQQLYDQFHRDEPWDSEHNRKLIAKMPEAFRSPASKHRARRGLATYRLVVGERTVFPGREGIEIKQITDGTSNTILAVEVDDEHAVVWTKPEGLPFNAKNPAEGMGGQFEGGFHCAICDGSGHFIKLPHDPERLRRLLMRDDGKPIPRR